MTGVQTCALPISAVNASLAWLTTAPNAGRSAGGRFPSSFNCSVSTPFLPRYLTRNASSVGRSGHHATSFKAASSNSETLEFTASAPTRSVRFQNREKKRASYPSPQPSPSRGEGAKMFDTHRSLYIFPLYPSRGEKIFRTHRRLQVFPSPARGEGAKMFDTRRSLYIFPSPLAGEG